eukprot:SAG31_NODE_3636_length_4035_cov_2.230691_5_plen_485_part_00
MRDAVGQTSAVHMQTFKTYVYWRTRITTGKDGPTGFRGMELTEDCRDVVVGSDTRITATANREGPAMFKHAGEFYLWVSGTMGWEPTTMYLYKASTPLGAFENSSESGHGWHAYTKGLSGDSSRWNRTWAVRSGYLASGSIFGKAEKRNVTLAAAEALCGGASACAGFTFRDYQAAPAAGKVLSVAFKTRVEFVAEHAVGLQPSPIPGPCGCLPAYFCVCVCVILSLSLLPMLLSLLPELRIVADSAESLPQLHVIEAAMKARCHLGIWCDSTGAKPIRGTRYTKPGAAGDSYDLCEAAWKALSLAEQKDFTVVERPDVNILLRTSRTVIEPLAPAAEPSTVDVDEASSHADLDAAWAAKARALRAQGITASPPHRPVPTPAAEEQTELLVSVASMDSPQDPQGANEQESEVPEQAAEQVVMASPVPAGVAVENFDLNHVPEVYRSQVERLIEMGYSQSVEQLTELVASNGGDLHATVMAMLGQ